MRRPETLNSSENKILVVAVAFPTILTVVYFNLLAGTRAEIQQAVYSLGKIVQFGFPIFWVRWVLKEKGVVVGPTRRDLIWGAGSGLFIFFAALTLFQFYLKPTGAFDSAMEAIRAKVKGLGVETPGKFIALSFFYALVHSGLEEYYWRWFLFGRMRKSVNLMPAILITGVGFMSHHVFLLATFFGWQSPLTYLLSLCVAIGGAGWAWLYEKTHSLYGPWLSHLLVDAIIFGVGFQLLF